LPSLWSLPRSFLCGEASEKRQIRNRNNLCHGLLLVRRGFEKVDGVINVVSGYTGGARATRPMNGVQVERAIMSRASPDPAGKSEYSRILKNVDPFDAAGQF
jgi:hypothetical protein